MKSLLISIFAAMWTLIGTQGIALADTVKLEVGDAAPEFSALDDQGDSWKSSEHVGKKILVVYFYPADMTGGCTAQACGYRDHADKLASKDVEVIGVSGDTVANHQAFKKAHQLNFTLLADTKGAIAKQFGVPFNEGEKSVEAMIQGTKQVLTRNVTTKRWTFLIGKDGKVVYKDDSVQAKEDPAKVLAAIESLK
jgi:thioredoxin-dependent peroxiredoxin